MTISRCPQCFGEILPDGKCYACNQYVKVEEFQNGSAVFVFKPEHYPGPIAQDAKIASDDHNFPAIKPPADANEPTYE